MIKLNRIAEAQAVFDQAKDKGAKGESFDKLEEKLTEAVKQKDPEPQTGGEVPQDQLQFLTNLYRQGALKQALEEIAIIMKKFPESANLYNVKGAVSML